MGNLVWPDGGIASASLRPRRPWKLPDGVGVVSSARAVVLRVRDGDAEASLYQDAIEVDVMVLDGTRNRIRRNVPVLQPGAGYSNSALWVPQATTLDLSTGGEVTFTGEHTLEGVGDPYALNGDHVLLMFVGNKMGDPIAVSGLPHPWRENKIKLSGELGDITAGSDLDGGVTHQAIPNGNVRFMKQHGTVLMVDRFGNVVIDTTGARENENARRGSILVNLGADEEIEVRGDGDRVFRVLADGNMRLGGGAPSAGVARLDDEVEITIPIGSVMVPASAAEAAALTGAGTPTAPGDPIPNTVPLTYTGTIITASSTVRSA